MIEQARYIPWQDLEPLTHMIRVFERLCLFDPGSIGFKDDWDIYPPHELRGSVMYI